MKRLIVLGVLVALGLFFYAGCSGSSGQVEYRACKLMPMGTGSDGLPQVILACLPIDPDDLQAQ